MKKILFLALCVTLLFSAASRANTNGDFTRLDRIIAVVNTEVITESQLDNELGQAKKQMEHSNMPIPSDGELRKKILDHLIDKALQVQLAKQKNIKVSNTELQTAIENIAKQNHLTLDQLKPALEQSGLNYSEFQARIQEQIMLQRLQQQEVVSKNVNITDEEVNAYLHKNQGRMQNYSAFHVLDMIAANEKQAQLVTKNLQSNMSMEDITKQTGAQNNDLGWRALTEFPSIFTTQIASMRVGEVSKPIHAPNGYHVLKLLDAKGDKVKLTKKDAQNLVFQTKASEAVKKWLEDLRKTAYIKIVR